MELLLALAVAAGVLTVIGAARLLGRARRRRHGPVEELGGLLAGGVPVLLPHRDAAYGETEDQDQARRDEELDLEEGALDPDEVEGDPLVWDEGADDELG